VRLVWLEWVGQIACPAGRRIGRDRGRPRWQRSASQENGAGETCPRRATGGRTGR
jgi:hypothetical protein